MKNEAWLQLSDYSNKYRVSVSTLRRRIKNGDIQNQFQDGKYWLPDQAIEKYVRNRTTAEEVHIPKETIEFPVSSVDFAVPTESFVTRNEVLEVVNSMISELKSAYVLVLQEKEVAIMEAKREVADLKTLCHTLESENEKLKAENNAPLSGWFLDEEVEA